MNGVSFLQLLGFSHQATSHAEKWISGVGALLGIASVCLVMLGLAHIGMLPATAIPMWLAPSMGATAVLLFAIPHSPFSQPWPVLGGYIVSAFFGVACARWLISPILGAALATGLSVLLMYYLRCLHPPGGAAALIPIANPGLSFDFVLNPILVGALSLLLVAILYNAFFVWRRYPVALAASRLRGSLVPVHHASPLPLNHEDLAWALRQMDTYIDIVPEDLCQLFALASEHHRDSQPRVRDVVMHGFYSNGQTGTAWQVYEVLAVISSGLSARRIHYRVVAGNQRGIYGEISLGRFLSMARIPVQLRNGLWMRLQT